MITKVVTEKPNMMSNTDGIIHGGYSGVDGKLAKTMDTSCVLKWVVHHT